MFDDFIAAAEWLIAQRLYFDAQAGDRRRLERRAAGRRLPDPAPRLFGAALPAVGVLDMLRFHKFTIGHAWVDDYGSSDDPRNSRLCYKYSPLHSDRPGTCYPPTLITTADHDDRVVPAHSFKFAADAAGGADVRQPDLIRIETKAGHGAGKPTAKIIEEAADRWAFLVKVLAIDVPSKLILCSGASTPSIFRAASTMFIASPWQSS